MKINFKQTVLLLGWIFSWAGSASLTAQTVSKTFRAEANYTPGSIISTKDAFETCFEVDGYINAYTTKDQKYQIWVSDGSEPVLEMDRNFAISTSDDTKIIHEVTIDVNTPNPADAQAIINALRINIFNNRAGHTSFDAMMNISSIKISNGFWRIDKNEIVLENGRKYEINSVKIKSNLQIPKTANLLLSSKYTHFNIEPLEGHLDINIRGGSVNAQKVNTIHAEVASTNIFIEEMKEGVIRSTKSTFTIQKADEIQVGESELNKKAYVRNPKMNYNVLCRRTPPNSNLNTYQFGEVNRVVVKQSNSDKFSFSMINNLEIDEGLFSNFTIKQLGKRLWSNCKNGDITVKSVSPQLQQIDIDNEVSELQLNLNQLAAYQIHLQDSEQIEMMLPTDVEEQTSSKTGMKAYTKGTLAKAPKINILCQQCILKVR